MSNNWKILRRFSLILSCFTVFSLGNTPLSANPSCYLIDSSGRFVNLDSLCKKTAVSTPTTPNPQSSTQTTPIPGMQTTPIPGMQTTPIPGMQTTPIPGMQTTPIPGMQTTPIPGMQTTQSPSQAENPPSNATTTGEEQAIQFRIRGRRLILIPSRQQQ